MVTQRIRLISISLLLVCAIIYGAVNASAQSNPRFIPFGGGANGALYVPNSGQAPHVAFLVSHRNSNYMTHASTAQLSSRGFMVLGMTVRAVNNEAAVNWPELALDIRSGVRFLRAQPGITKVILIAHSGGGPLMSFYQAVAENGPAYCQGPNKIIECSSQLLAGFVPTDRADGIVFLDAHPGTSVLTLRNLNAAVNNEDQPFQALNPTLDPFNIKNGFNPDGQSVYSAEFQKKYFRAQSDRMNALIDTALDIKQLMAEGKYHPVDEDAFIIYRGRAGLFNMSTNVLRGTLNKAKLLKNDGTIVTQVINSVRPPDPTARENDQLMGSGNSAGVKELTITAFLTANAIRSDSSLEGIDWCSSNDSTICAIRQIHVPVMIGAMGGHYFIRDSEMYFENGAMTDKELIVIEGATHGIGNCTACAAYWGTGPYTNVPLNTWNYVAAWTNARF